MFLAKPAVRTWIALLLIAGVSLAVRLVQRDHFRKRPVYWALTASHLAHARALTEGHLFHYVESDWVAADRFINKEADGFTRPLSELAAMTDSLRALSDSLVYVPNWGDQGGWSFYYLFARALGLDTLSEVVLPQIVLDVIATLVLFPIVGFVTGRRWPAFAVCLLYAVYPPEALIVASPFRDGWPGFAAILGTGLLLPVWKGGPRAALRNLGWVVAAGVVIGFMAYGRTTAALTPVTLSALTWIAWRRFIPAAAVGATLVAVVLITLLPWMHFTWESSRVVSIVTSGGGHSTLTGLAEQENPLGLRFDDHNILSYIIEACGYDVEYASYPYDAAARTEGRQFIADHRGWFAGMLTHRFYRYVVRDDKQRILWGFLAGPVRRAGERYVALLGFVGLFLGLFVFPRTWIPLAWALHFMIFVLPIQSHPRLLLGGDWAFLTGVVMLFTAPWLLWRRWRARAKRLAAPREGARGSRGKRKAVPAAATKPIEEPAVALEPRWPRGLLVVGGAAVVFDLVVAVLLRVHAPVAPPPQRDWRRVFREGSVAEQVALIQEVGAIGRASFPIMKAGERSPSPEVRAAAVEAVSGYKVMLVDVDFSEPNVLSAIQAPPSVRMEVVQDPQARDGYALRITGPARPFMVMLVASFPQTRRGIYGVGLRARFNRPLIVGVANQAANDLRWWEDLAPQALNYQEFHRYYDNTFGDEFINLVLVQGKRAPGDSTAFEGIVDVLQVTQER